MNMFIAITRCLLPGSGAKAMRWETAPFGIVRCVRDDIDDLDDLDDLDDQDDQDDLDDQDDQDDLGDLDDQGDLDDLMKVARQTIKCMV